MSDLEIFTNFLNSNRPLVFAGHGIKTSGLEFLLTKTIEELELPIIVTSHAKGIFPENHPLYFGTFGFASTEMSTLFLKSYQPDAIIFLGSRLGELSTLGWSKLLGLPNLKIHVDRDAALLNRSYSMTFSICDEIANVLNSLLEINEKKINKSNRMKSKNSLKLIKNKIVKELPVPPSFDPQTIPIHPSHLIKIFHEVVENDAIIFSDIGNSMAWAIHDLVLTKDQEFYFALGLGSMGSGIGSSLGAKSMLRNRPIYCLVGDASMLMHGNDIFTALQNNLGVVFIILNDNGHGMVDHGSKIVGFSSGNVRFNQSINFKKWAESMKINSYSINSINDFLKIPFSRLSKMNQPTVIDVKINKSIVPPILSRTNIIKQSGRETI